MVGLNQFFSSRSLTFACALATVVLNGANAAVLDRRQDAAEGELTSVTSTSSSAESTTTAAPTTTSAEDAAETTSKTSSASSTETLAPIPTDFPTCEDTSVVFCLPENGTEKWAGDTYYATWNPDKYPINSTITVELNYANSSGLGGESAYSSLPTSNRLGYVTITMEEDWLQEHDRNNLTLYLIMADETSDKSATFEKGPTISLVNKPIEHHKPPPPTPVPNKLGLMVGLPVSLGVVFIIAIGLCLGMKKRRHIGLGSVMGGRKKGYGTGKSIGQRLGGGSRRQNDAIRLGELEEDPDRYTDDPNAMRRGDSEYHDERAQGEVFRPDIGRMKSWK
ncbi:hypothetical protein FQN54_000354 [Arachnomyces sp. PD_36]|nr:hypothetical protein FQN54_000354 [Arachnomyces sp. PD_36]